MKNKTFHLISLGCAKNTVDSHSMAELLETNGYQAVSHPKSAEVIIVNTCGFIEPARDESFQILRELSQNKGRGQKLIAAGCLTERYRENVISKVPGLDGILGTRRWMDILEVVENVKTGQNKYHIPPSCTIGTDEHGVLRVAIQGGSAYLKIADGCRRPCAFCAIPMIKGTTVSRPANMIIQEAKALEAMGIKEIILIAQDTTDYGYDRGEQDGLAKLLLDLTKAIPNVPWIRILYAFPGFVTDRLIKTMADQPQIVPYLDMPLQHADPEILIAMKRPANIDWVYRTLETLRRTIPTIALRSTFIVGYPGETQAQFNSLLKFTKEIQFDHVGVFTYSMEEGTSAASLLDPIPAKEKQRRMDELMELQATISLQRNQMQIGKTLDILVEGINEDITIGRTYRDAPEIDGLAIAEGCAEIGSIVPMRVTGAMTHDLTGILTN